MLGREGEREREGGREREGERGRERERGRESNPVAMIQCTLSYFGLYAGSKGSS